ncbi:sigma-70 family RNA polymerase sigma factor [Bacteroides xylanisolvens]|uniref:RNA polymerase sigma factor n=1 Tax=Bacteroides xylanisolvens TaxID=371601 RepID=UPI001BA9ED22|nr:sigma-70 family RNA polymerase sigma factor [Bacteroides xylanisolvens]QUR44249.1 sigma-70 family RNA polymerase sigma factor [Bacteroides xylanisolvens]
MGLVFLNNYAELNDKEIVNKIINKPYNEEAAAYLIYNRYDPLLHKLYREIYDKDPSWYEDCLGDLFGFLKGKERDWNKLRTFQWRSKFGAWLSSTARHRFIEIKPYLIGKIENPLSIDDTDGDKAPVQLPENGGEEYERLERKILLMEAVGMLKDPDQKFVILKRLQGYNSKEIAELMKKSWAKHGIKKYDNKGNLVVPTSGYVDVRTQRAKENLKEIIVKLL